MVSESIEVTQAQEIAIVGGGLAGLVAATIAAKNHRTVVLYEQAKELGGRAATTVSNGVCFNLGPRALYRMGDAFRLLNELEVSLRGSVPSPGTALGYLGGREYPLPQKPWSLLTTRLLSWTEKWRLVSFFRNLPRVDSNQSRQTSLENWVHQSVGAGALAELLFAMFRLSTYAADVRNLSAGDGIDQLKLALQGNVLYIDGGWQSLIGGLREKALSLGVKIHSAEKIVSVRRGENGIHLTTSLGHAVLAKNVVLAISPREVCRLLDLPPGNPFVDVAQGLRPVRAACLDVALTRLPRPKYRFALGLDQPFYFSVHSAAAQLAPEGTHVLHVLKYLGSDEERSGKELEAELESFLERVQPGWRSHVLTRRMLPSMIVSHALPEANRSGTRGRPGVDCCGIPGVLVAGDWVGQRGQLADAAAASAEEAIHRILNGGSNVPERVVQHV